MGLVGSSAGYRRRSALRLAAGVGLLALAATACSSDSKGTSSGGSSGSSSGSSTADLSVLGTAKPATGTAVTIGMITEGGSEAIGSQSALAEQGAQIAKQYVNEYLGGIGGKPIDLFVCGNKSTPAGAQDCANQMVEKKVAAVIWPFTGQGASVPIITGAGIPIIASSGSSTEELTTPGVFVLTGGYPATLGVYAQDAKDRGIKKFAMLVIDVPAATQGAQALGGIVFKNAGVDFSVITAPPGTPDLTPQLQDAVSQGADAVGVTGDVTFCTSFLKAYQTLALTLPKYVIATCNDQSVTAALPDVLAGSIEATISVSAGSPDAKLYAAMVQKYAPGKGIDPDPAKSSGVSLGASTVMNFIAGMKGFTGEPTPANIATQFKTVKGAVFLGGGITYDCSSKPISIIPNICSAALQLGTVNADGTVSNTKPVDSSGLFKT
jgi:branched-chain amino acid transport system substrate-binding protein